MLLLEDKVLVQAFGDGEQGAERVHDGDEHGRLPQLAAARRRPVSVDDADAGGHATRKIPHALEQGPLAASTRKRSRRCRREDGQGEVGQEDERFQE